MSDDDDVSGMSGKYAHQKEKKRKKKTGYKSNKSKSFTYVKARLEYTHGAYIILFYLFLLRFILKDRSQRFTYILYVKRNKIPSCVCVCVSISPIDIVCLEALDICIHNLQSTIKALLQTNMYVVGRVILLIVKS